MSDETTAPASEGGRRALHHQVYVITLKASVRENRKFMAANPGYIAGKPCVYVGMTGIDPEKRLIQHREGHKDAPIARKFGKGLRRGVPGTYRSQTYAGAAKREREVAARLRALGWAVWQN